MISAVMVGRTKDHKRGPNREPYHDVSDDLKLIISWIQIQSTLTTTFNSVPWGSSFTSFSRGAGVPVNLDVSQAFSSASCRLSLPFLMSFQVSVILTCSIAVSVVLGSSIGMCFTRHLNDHAHRRQAQRSVGSTWLLTLLLLMYPRYESTNIFVFSSYRNFCNTQMHPHTHIATVSDTTYTVYPTRHSLFSDVFKRRAFRIPSLEKTLVSFAGRPNT